jgi:hypothetical protein
MFLINQIIAKVIILKINPNIFILKLMIYWIIINNNTLVIIYNIF